MKPIYALLIATCGLAACGVDGEPQQPVSQDGTPGVPVNGNAVAGMSVGSSGVRGYGTVGLTRGAVSLTLGF